MKRHRRWSTAAALAAIWLLTGMTQAWAQDAFWSIRIGDMKFTEGGIPPHDSRRADFWNAQVTVQLEGGEGYVTSGDPEERGGGNTPLTNFTLTARAPAGKPAAGRLIFLLGEYPGQQKTARFELDPAKAKKENELAFQTARYFHYSELTMSGQPGAAWFRHQQDKTAARIKELGGSPQVDRNNQAWRWRRNWDDDGAMDLFTGSRAISENLQLDRPLIVGEEKEPDVDIGTLTGITIRPMDFAARIKGLEIPTDALAALIPSDQHAMFHKSFADMTRMMDQSESMGDLAMSLSDPQGQQEMIREKYETQLCLSSSMLSRLLGPKVIKSIAMTGGDPYFMSGTDVAILFEASQPMVLLGYLEARHVEAAQKDESIKRGDVVLEGVQVRSAVSADRSVSSYVASLPGGIVIVSNSQRQIQRLLQTHQKKIPALADESDYKFFRHRYPLSQMDEMGFLMVPDAAIRRWCSPQWRIGCARRVRAAATMAEYQARHAAEILSGKATVGPVKAEPALFGSNEMSMGPAGVHSRRYGGLAFQTPISELDIATISSAEKRAYENWKRGYERNWNGVFDPIGLSIRGSDQKLGADLTVLPLIGGSEYNELIDFTRGAKINPAAVDVHPEALLHVAMAINKQSRTLAFGRGFANSIAPALTDPLSWLGETVTLYMDDDPFWADLKKAQDPMKFMEANWWKMPIAVQIESTDGLKLAAFLTGLRVYVDTSAPQSLTWEAMKHGESGYVRIRLSDQMRDGQPAFGNVAFYYAQIPGGLLLTINENLMKRALDRQKARREAKAAGKPAESDSPEWLSMGRNLVATVRPENLLPAMVLGNGSGAADQDRRVSYGNLPILNEYARHFPGMDPIKVHRKLFAAKLACPSGGAYRMNVEDGSMESTIYGHPGRSLTAAAHANPLANFEHAHFGLSFEDGGLRVRMEVKRKSP